jgi:predicted ferric reductase
MIPGVALAWSVDRAAGVAALLLASGTLVLGLMQSQRGRSGRGLAAIELHTLHEGLSIAVLVALAIHGLTFAIDPFFHSGVAAAIVPFDSPYRPLAVGVGQVAAYGLLALSLSFYLRRRIGTPRWRSAHRAIPLFWGLGVLHGLLAGSDSHQPWFLLSVLPPVLVALALLGARWHTRTAATAGGPAPSARRRARDGRARAPVPPTRTAAGGSRAGR